jgi:MoxR-like ATPase
MHFMSTALEDLEQRLQQAVGTAVIGLQPVVRALCIAVVARGHVLIQGVPGLGKTLLSKALASALGGDFKRIQGTADLMPADIIGVHVYDAPSSQFVFRAGPVFADVLLFDEVNRAGPKTQSALLEAMEERQVTVDGRIYPLSAGFLVLATQNPRDFEGTYPLPESQLDRFMLRLDLAYPAQSDELEVLSRYGHIDGPGQGRIDAVVTPGLLQEARQAAEQIHVAPELARYVLALVQATRQDTQVSLGLSTRGALAVIRAARVAAGLRGATFVTPDDVKSVWPLITPHRVFLAADAVLEGITEKQVIERLIEQVPVPR